MLDKVKRATSSYSIPDTKAVLSQVETNIIALRFASIPPPPPCKPIPVFLDVEAVVVVVVCNKISAI